MIIFTQLYMQKKNVIKKEEESFYDSQTICRAPSHPASKAAIWL